LSYRRSVCAATHTCSCRYEQLGNSRLAAGLDPTGTSATGRRSDFRGRFASDKRPNIALHPDGPRADDERPRVSAGVRRSRISAFRFIDGLSHCGSVKSSVSDRGCLPLASRTGG
jgi:hypothetical protein